jgi:glycosyltransferase involved in cell wall biosynthesis
MRVIVAHNRYRSALPSGENAIVHQEIGWLRAANVEVFPFLPASDEMSLRDKAFLPISPIWAAPALTALARLIRATKPHVLHLHNPYPLISPWAVRTAHKLGVPVVQTVHNYRHVCASGNYFRSGGPCTECLGRRLALPAIRHACYRGSRAQSAVMAATLAVHRPTWRSVDRYLAPAVAIAEHLRLYGIPDDRITIRPHAVDDPGPFAAGGEGVLFAGRLSEEKGLRLLLDAWKPSLGTLRIAGDGPLRDLARPHWLGRLDRGGVADAIRACALVVVPSLVADVHPTIVIEALAHGRPVLGTRIGGIPELVGDAGWVVQPNALAATLPVAITEALGRQPIARERYLDCFTPTRAMDSLLAVYGDLHERRPGGVHQTRGQEGQIDTGHDDEKPEHRAGPHDEDRARGEDDRAVVPDDFDQANRQGSGGDHRPGARAAQHAGHHVDHPGSGEGGGEPEGWMGHEDERDDQRDV